MTQASKQDQLRACADWNSKESKSAFIASKSKVLSDEQKDYYARRAVRLSEQAINLYEQADDIDRHSVYEDHCLYASGGKWEAAP